MAKVEVNKRKGKATSKKDFDTPARRTSSLARSFFSLNLFEF
jgi:hypothetical protein